MIKLELTPKPSQLAVEEAVLTAEFIADNSKPVWNKKYIKDALLDMSNNKCAYSEVRLNTTSTYLEVEHFKHKNKYQKDVVKWGNLLPSCKKCNVTKGDWDVETEPIVNPLVDEPKKHLYVEAFRFYARDKKGDNTIVALALNDNSHFTRPRAYIALEIIDSLHGCLNAIKDATTELKQKREINRLKNIIRQALPSEEFSAVIATHILYESHLFNEIELILQQSNKWDEELISIKKDLVRIAMPK